MCIRDRIAAVCPSVGRLRRPSHYLGKLNDMSSGGQSAPTVHLIHSHLCSIAAECPISSERTRQPIRKWFQRYRAIGTQSRSMRGIVYRVASSAKITRDGSFVVSWIALKVAIISTTEPFGLLVAVDS